MTKLKVLMVGNSFSLSVGKEFPQIVASTEDELILCNTYIGGCTLERHWNHLQEADRNPDFKPYRLNLWHGSRNPEQKSLDWERAGSVNEALALGDWDIVTIQQGSHQSWNYDFYQPYADGLIARIRKEAPMAQIWIQQTWAYNPSDWRLVNSPFYHETDHWEFDQTGMYERLTDAYTTLAQKHSFPVIPVGYAVQLYRQNASVKGAPLNREQYDKMKYPETLMQAGEPVGRYLWEISKDKLDPCLRFDSIHLNPIGEYLQGCVWYLGLFGNHPEKIVYCPEWLSADEARFCREMASQAVRNFPLCMK